VDVLKDVPASVHHSPEQIGVGTRARQHVADQVHDLQPQCLKHVSIILRNEKPKTNRQNPLSIRQMANCCKHSWMSQCILIRSRDVDSVSETVSRCTNVASRSRLDKKLQRLGLGYLRLVPKTLFCPN